MHWFTSVVLAYAEKHGNKYGWKSMLARKLDESPSTVKNWTDTGCCKSPFRSTWTKIGRKSADDESYTINHPNIKAACIYAS